MNRKNPKFKFFIILLILTVLISVGIYTYVTRANQLKILGCTQFDTYDGNSPHTKLPPTDVNCSLNMLDLNSSNKSKEGGIVEYDLNMMGDLEIVVLFVIIPLVLGYALLLGGYNFITTPKVETKLRQVLKKVKR